MLVYERKLKKDIREVANPGSDEEEKINEVNFRNIQPSIPEWLQNWIQKDNFELMIDRQVFDRQFFMLIKLLLRHISSELCMTQHKYDLDYLPNFYKMNKAALKIGHKIVFEFLSHYQENSVLNYINGYLQTILNACDSWVSFVRRAEQPSIVNDWIDEVLLKDNCASFLDIMLNCPSEVPRKHCGEIISKAVVGALRIVEVCEMNPEQA